MKPSAEKILSLLIELYAQQMGVKVKYEIETRKWRNEETQREGALMEAEIQIKKEKEEKKRVSWIMLFFFFIYPTLGYYSHTASEFHSQITSAELTKWMLEEVDSFQ